jgi:internalin A
VTDAGLVPLSKMTNLTVLALGLTRVTDAGLAHLSSLKNLTGLGLGNTGVTIVGAAELRKHMPNTTIHYW